MVWITERGLAGKFLATLGVLAVAGELFLHFLSWRTGKTYEMNETVVLVGALLGFVGFYILDPSKTKDGIAVIQDFVPRFGRRKTDPVAIPDVKTEVIAEPVKPPGDS